MPVLFYGDTSGVPRAIELNREMNSFSLSMRTLMHVSSEKKENMLRKGNDVPPSGEKAATADAVAIV